MPTTRKDRVLPTSPERVWRVVGDPHHLPRWWPRVGRVESVEEDRWTMVLKTSKGKPVRADYVLVESEPLTARAWAQEIEDSPFERFMRASVTRIELEDIGGGSTRVRIIMTQKMRGFSRFGGFLTRRATGRILEEALDGLSAATGR